MTKYNIQPVSEWYSGDPSDGYVTLKDPTGSGANPLLLSTIISSDAYLGPALQAVADEHDDLTATVICSMQESGDDLGPEGAFEELADRSQLFGDQIWGFHSPASDPYTARAHYAARKGVIVFNFLDWVSKAEPQTDDAIKKIGSIMEQQSHELSLVLYGLISVGQYELERLICESKVSTECFNNTVLWAATSVMCLQVVSYRKRHGNGPLHMIVGVAPEFVGIGRMLSELGIQTTTERYGIDDWPEDIAKIALSTGATAETGRVYLPRAQSGEW